MSRWPSRSRCPPQTIALADRLRAELDRVDGLLDGFLALARAQHGELPGQATLSLDYVTAAALAVRDDAIAARHLTVHHATGSDGTWVTGSQALLCRMVDNVLDNAIGHNRDGGWISVTTGPDGHRRAWSWRPAATSSTPARSPSSPSRSGGSARTGPAPTTAPGSACRSSRPSPRRTAAPSACGPGRAAACAVAITLPLAPRGAPWPAAGGPGMRVLVVEDSRSLAEVLVEGLRDQGMAVDAARDGLEAAAKLDVNSYDVVVLDRDLPGIHGDTLCQMITEQDDRVMVLMLTAAGSPGDRVSGLGLGADDYLAKPFHFPELVLRIRALARRQPAARPGSCARPGSSWTRCGAPSPATGGR